MVGAGARAAQGAAWAGLLRRPGRGMLLKGEGGGRGRESVLQVGGNVSQVGKTGTGKRILGPRDGWESDFSRSRQLRKAFSRAFEWAKTLSGCRKRFPSLNGKRFALPNRETGSVSWRPSCLGPRGQDGPDLMVRPSRTRVTPRRNAACPSLPLSLHRLSLSLSFLPLHPPSVPSPPFSSHRRGLPTEKNAAGGRYRPQHQLQQVSTIDLHRRVRVGLGWALGKLGNWASLGPNSQRGRYTGTLPYTPIYAHSCPSAPIPFPSPPILPTARGPARGRPTRRRPESARGLAHAHVGVRACDGS